MDDRRTGRKHPWWSRQVCQEICEEELGPGWETEIDNPLVPFNSQSSGKCSPLNKFVFIYVISFNDCKFSYMRDGVYVSSPESVWAGDCSTS